MDNIELDLADKNETTDYEVRVVRLPENYTVLPSMDRDVFDMDFQLSRASRAVKYAKATPKPFVSDMFGSASHTVLAACGKDQTAKEIRGRGQFTSALMVYLRDPSVDNTLVTFRDIIENLGSLQE